MAVSSVALYLGAFGLFIDPLASAFGWTRAQVAIGLSLHMLAAAVAFPLAGRFFDRNGSVRMLVLATLAYCAVVALHSMLDGSLIGFYILTTTTALTSALASPVTFSKMVARRFAARRGLALGVSLCGIGIGGIVAPPVLQAVIEGHGWRMGYLTMATAIAVVGLPALTLLRKRDFARSDIMSGAPGHALLRSRTFLLMFGSFALMAPAITGFGVNMVPLLAGRGLPPAAGALALSALAAAVILGRIGSGWLLDRVFAPYVAAGTSIASAVGVLLIVFAPVGPWSYVGAALIGTSAGAEIDVMAYFVVRYFGLGSFGFLFGVLSSGHLLGSAVGPVIVASANASFGGYGALAIGLALMLVVSAVLALLLPRYPPVPKVTASLP